MLWRRRAEEQAAIMGDDALTAFSPDEARRLFHELRVHQIELEMQNEELRRAQEALESSRARYFDLYDLAPVGYITINEHGLILEANLRAASLLGMSHGALVKQPLTHFVSPADQDIYYGLRKQLFETGAAQACELRLVRAECDAPIAWVHLEATLMRGEEGSAPICHATISDITKRKRAEQAAIESEFRYRDLFENASLAIFQSSPEGKILAVNPAFLHLFGYESSAELIAATHNNAAEVFADPQRRAELVRLQAENPNLKTFENLYRRKDGRIFTGQLTVNRVTDSVGQVLYLEGFIEDITARNLAEESLHESERRLRLAQQSAGAGIWIGTWSADT